MVIWANAVVFEDNTVVFGPMKLCLGKYGGNWGYTVLYGANTLVFGPKNRIEFGGKLSFISEKKT